MANPEHVAKLKEGVAAWNGWREENLTIKPDLRSADFSKADFSEADLAWTDLSGAKLIGADLSGANLIGAKLIGTDLSGAKLIGANLIGADLIVAKLNDAHLYDADLSGAKLIGANLSGALLYGANLSGANLRGANLTDADVADLRYLEPVRGQQWRISQNFGIQGAFSLWLWLRTNPIPYRRGMMRGLYRAIRGLSSSYGNRLFVRDAADQDYLDTLEDQWRHNPLWQFVFWLWGLFDYGRSLLSVIVFASILILGFGWVYAHRLGMLSYGGRHPTVFTPYYFSIVTYTTLGFGDVRPNNLVGEILVSVEVILGYVTLGLLLAVLAEKIARRS